MLAKVPVGTSTLSNIAARRLLHNFLPRQVAKRCLATRAAGTFRTTYPEKGSWWTTGRALSLAAFTGGAVYGLLSWRDGQQLDSTARGKSVAPPSYGTMEDMHVVSWKR